MCGKNPVRRRGGEPDPPSERASGMLADPWGQIDRWVNEGGAGLEVGPKPKPVDRANDHGREREDRDPLCKDVL